MLWLGRCHGGAGYDDTYRAECSILRNLTFYAPLSSEGCYRQKTPRGLPLPKIFLFGGAMTTPTTMTASSTWPPLKSSSNGGSSAVAGGVFLRRLRRSACGPACDWMFLFTFILSLGDSTPRYAGSAIQHTKKGGDLARPVSHVFLLSWTSSLQRYWLFSPPIATDGSRLPITAAEREATALSGLFFVYVWSERNEGLV